MRKFVKIAVVAAVAAGLASSASAGTDTKNLSVSASVAAACTFVGGSLLFGSYTGAQLDVNGSVQATCANGTNYTIALDAGLGVGASTTTRKLTATGGTLDYTLYRDSTRLQNWGSNTGTDTLAGSGTGGAQTITIYGRIASGLNPVAGSYTDTVHATISF